MTDQYSVFIKSGNEIPQIPQNKKLFTKIEAFFSVNI